MSAIRIRWSTGATEYRRHIRGVLWLADGSQYTCELPVLRDDPPEADAMARETILNMFVKAGLLPAEAVR